MSRFDYIKYDDIANKIQGNAKDASVALEAVIETLPAGRAKALALTKLEEVYMWVGKAVRDLQIERNAAYELQERRGA